MVTTVLHVYRQLADYHNSTYIGVQTSDIELFEMDTKRLFVLLEQCELDTRKKILEFSDVLKPIDDLIDAAARVAKFGIEFRMPAARFKTHSLNAAGMSESINEESITAHNFSDDRSFCRLQTFLAQLQDVFRTVNAGSATLLTTLADAPHLPEILADEGVPLTAWLPTLQETTVTQFMLASSEAFTALVDAFTAFAETTPSAEVTYQQFFVPFAASVVMQKTFQSGLTVSPEAVANSVQRLGHTSSQLPSRRL